MENRIRHKGKICVITQEMETHWISTGLMDGLSDGWMTTYRTDVWIDKATKIYKQTH